MLVSHLPTRKYTCLGGMGGVRVRVRMHVHNASTQGTTRGGCEMRLRVHIAWPYLLT